MCLILILNLEIILNLIEIKQVFYKMLEFWFQQFDIVNI